MTEKQWIRLNKENIGREHICCAFSDKKCQEGYEMKKAWLSGMFEDDYRFIKLNVKHKVFIEYGPAEKSWFGVNAPGYNLIGCFWVAGSYKGSGYGRQLLEMCLQDSQTKHGVVAVTGGKKRPFMHDTRFLKKFGFNKTDTAKPYFELWVKKNNLQAPDPKFLEIAKQGDCENKKGLTVYYSNCCPFTEYYVNELLVNLAAKKQIPIKIVKAEQREEARNFPVPYPIHSVFYNGTFITHEILSEKKFDKIILPLSE